MEDNFQLRPKPSEAAITPRTKAILIGYPNNPTGAVAARETLLEAGAHRRGARPDGHLG